MWQDFKKFAFKGNVIDMAIGIIIGGAFSKIVTALVNNIITPLLSLIIGKMNLSDLKWVITPATTTADGVTVAENAVLYGSFIQSVIDFFIIAFCIFFFIRIMTAARKKFERKNEEVVAPEVKAPTAEELLTEIRDLLKAEKEQ